MRGTKYKTQLIEQGRNPQMKFLVLGGEGRGECVCIFFLEEEKRCTRQPNLAKLFYGSPVWPHHKITTKKPKKEKKRKKTHPYLESKKDKNMRKEEIHTRTSLFWEYVFFFQKRKRKCTIQSKLTKLFYGSPIWLHNKN